MPPKTIGLIAHTGKPGIADLVNAIVREFGRFSISVLLEKETAAIAGKKSGHSMPELGAGADLLVVAGGDGTILRVVGQLGEVIKPIFGINVGSLGFLTCASSSTYREAVECIAKDRINFSQRALLEARVKLGEKQTAKMIALNDAVLSRGELSRLVGQAFAAEGLSEHFGRVAVSDRPDSVPSTVTEAIYAGVATTFMLETPGLPAIRLRAPTGAGAVGLQPGAAVRLWWDPAEARAFVAEAGT